MTQRPPTFSTSSLTGLPTTIQRLEWLSMFTYQLQRRLIHLQGGNSTFPNKLKIEIRLGPPEVFGTSDKPSRTFLYGSATEFLLDGNTGRRKFLCKPPLEP